MEQESLIAEFKAVTKENDERSRFYLESSNWQLDVALGSFYDNVGDFGDAESTPQAVGGETPMEADVQFFDAKKDASDTLTKQSNPPGSSSRFRSLADYDRAEDKKKDDDSDEEGQEFYAGGSEHSGEVIVGPGKKKNSEDIVSRMFKNAKKHGAVPVEEEASSSSQKKGTSYFTGGGYKLGMSETDHEFVPGAEKSKENRKLDVVLKLWKDGFTVGDGPLRPYHDEESKVFLGAVAKGEIPQELIRLARGGEVSLDMEDHKNEEYKPEKKKIAPFSGQGHTLGGVAPTVVSSEPRPKPEETSSVDPKVIIDETAPVTTIRIQLGDGSRVTQKFNHSHTVAHVYSFVRDCNPGDNRRFVLMTTFPNKELKEDTTTLKRGNLLNAVIVQRFK